MTNETHTLHIKNMVCHRCIMAVDHALRTLGLHPLSVELGIAITAEKLTPELRLRVKKALEALEFELIDDRRMQTVQQVKDLIVNLVHHSTEQPIQTNLSDYLARTIGKDYGTLSKLFSEITGTTIEKYVILQKTERVKELLTDSGYSYPGYVIYLSALYTFYTMFLSVVNIVKFRKLGSPILSAAKVLNFIAALMSVLGLQTAMIAQFSTESDHFRQIMNAITGGGIWAAVILTAVIMLYRSKRNER